MTERPTSPDCSMSSSSCRAAESSVVGRWGAASPSVRRPAPVRAWAKDARTALAPLRAPLWGAPDSPAAGAGVAEAVEVEEVVEVEVVVEVLGPDCVGGADTEGAPGGAVAQDGAGVDTLPQPGLSCADRGVEVGPRPESASADRGPDDGPADGPEEPDGPA